MQVPNNRLVDSDFNEHLTQIFVGNLEKIKFKYAKAREKLKILKCSIQPEIQKWRALGNSIEYKIKKEMEHVKSISGSTLEDVDFSAFVKGSDTAIITTNAIFGRCEELLSKKERKTLKKA